MAHVTQTAFRALGSASALTLLSPSEKEGALIARAVVEEVGRIEAKFSRYTTSGVIAAINSAAGRAPVKVDDETAALIDYAFACFEQSHGLFDITSGALRRAWDFKSGRIPDRSTINAILPLIGLQRATWTCPHFSLPKPGMEIDFGGFGKEYAVDRAAILARSMGAMGGFINLGGDIRVFGPKADGSPWSIGVQHPRDRHGTLAQVRLSEGALTTSGDYERYMEVDGTRYSHILNPETGWPVVGFQSVSVCGDSCLVVGSISTIAMLLGVEKGLSFLRESRLPYLAVTANDRYTNSDHFS